MTFLFNAINDVRLLIWLLIPYLISCSIAYLITGFVQWSRDPGNWTWDARFVSVLFAMFWGIALQARLEADRKRREKAT